jgi:hypothetical protein
MTISVVCSKCQKQHNAPDSLAGRACRCKCGNVIQVPAAEPAGGMNSLFDELSTADLDRIKNVPKAAPESAAHANPRHSPIGAELGEMRSIAILARIKAGRATQRKPVELKTVVSGAPKREMNWGWFWLAACVLGAACFFGRGAIGPSAHSPVAAAGTSTALPATKSIEQIQVGDRVLTEIDGDLRRKAIGNAALLTEWDRPDVQIDPAAWRKISLLAIDPSGSRFDVTLLRPLTWLGEVSAVVGRSIDLVLPEQGFEGPAYVHSIEACPIIKKGRGPLVTGTFSHMGARAFDLHFDGLAKALGVTNNHRVYSFDRGDFVNVGELHEGEHLQNLEGNPVRLSRIDRRPHSETVYNLEVQRDHVYRVTGAGLLVHNDCVPFPSTAEEMDKFLGFKGTRIPDGLFPGRNKVVWKPADGIKIVMEAHPYDPGIPGHTDPHFHLDVRGLFDHERFMPGDPIPGF